MQFNNLKIGAKIIIAMVFVGAIGVGATVLTAVQLHDVDATYSDLLERRSKAILDTARASRAANDVLAQAYKVIAYPANSAGESAGRTQIEQSYTTSLDLLKRSAVLIPALQSDYDSVSKQISDLKLGVDKAIEFGRRDENEKALLVMDEVDGQLRAVVGRITALNDNLSKDTDITSVALTASTKRTILLAIVGSLLGILSGIGLALLMSIRSITGPLARLRGAMGRLAESDFDVEVEGQTRRDEIGEMAKAVLIFKQNGLEMKRLEDVSAETDRLSQGERLRNEKDRQKVEAEKAEAVKQQALVVSLLDTGLDRLAHGDLTYRIAEDVAPDYLKLRDNFNSAVSQLAQTIATIQSTSSECANAAHEINMGADDLSKRTEEQASSLEETAATTEELAASVKASANASRQAANIADEAMRSAEGGGAIAVQAVAAMARIETASKQISDIIRVIDDIAFQTNLLALNAAVEAARAGDAGKGFAVVASEVRTLAQRSGEAAKDITALISSSNTEVGQGVKLVRQAGEALTQILAASQRVSATIAEISMASGEQANGIDEMSQTVAHLDEMTQQNAALAEQSAASATSLTGRVAELNQLVGAFKIGASAQLPDLVANRSTWSPAVVRGGRRA